MLQHKIDLISMGVPAIMKGVPPSRTLILIIFSVTSVGRLFNDSPSLPIVPQQTRGTRSDEKK